MTASNSKILRARESGNPVIEGSEVTFFWDGRTAPTLVGDFNHWDSCATPFKRLSPRPHLHLRQVQVSTPLRTSLQPASTKSTWYCTLSLPRDAYVEYAFHDPVSQKNFTDPLNKKSVNNGVGGRNNFFYMHETMPSPFAMRRADISGGALTSHVVETGLLREDYQRTIYLYRPPVKKPVPLLIVYDGQDYLQRGKLAVIVDNLIAEKRIQPIAIAFLPNGGRWRSAEYACSDATLHWVKHIILPLAGEQLNLLGIKKHPGTYGVLGASAGALMSLYTGLRLPDIFGKVLSQSGVSALDGHEFATVDLVKHQHACEIHIWMDVGKLDVLLEDNQNMYALLQEKGYNVTYREFSGGHNFTAWRDDVWRGLEEMFPSR